MAIEFLQDIKILGSDGSTTTIEGSGQSTLNLKTTTNSKNNYIVGSTSGSLSFRPNGTEALILDLSKNATFKGSITAPNSLNFTANAAYIKVGTSWNTGVLNFLNGSTTYLQFDVPNGRIKNNLGSYLTASSGTAKFGSFDNQSMSLVTNNTARLTINTSGDATFAGTITIPEYILHTGDGNTYFGFGGADDFRVGVGGTKRLNVHTGGVEITGNLTGATNATFGGDIRLPNGGKLYTWTDHDLNYLKYDIWRASASAGMTIENISSEGEIYLKSGNALALTLDDSQKATFSGNVLASQMLFTTLNGHAHIDSQSSSLMIEASNIQAMGNLIPDGNGNRPLGASNRYWSHLYANGITTKAINITQTADVGELTTANLDSGAAVGLSLTYPTSNVAAGDGLAMSIGIAGRGRSYIANKNTSNNLDASNLEFYTEGGGVINKVLTLSTEKEATFTGEIYTPDGSASAPSYSFSGRTDTGMYAAAHSSNDRIHFATDGSQRFYIDGNGTTSVGNSYVGENNSFRNYAGDWGGTTGTANKGFYFLNTANSNTTKAMEVTHDGNATFNRNVTLYSSLTFDYGGDHYLESGTNTWNFKNSSGTVLLQLDHSDTSATFSKDVTLTDGVLTVNDGNNYVKISEGTNSIGQIELKDGNPVFVQGWGSEFRVGVGTYDNTAFKINSAKAATFHGNLQIDGDNSQFYVKSADKNIARIIPRGGTGDNLDKGLFSLMSTVSGESTVEKVRIDSSGNTWFNGGNVSFGYDVTVTGNLIVEGTTTTLNTQTVEVEDNIIVLNKTQSDNSATAATSGISIYRGLDASDNAITEASLIFDDADDTWDLTNNLKVGGDVTLYQNNINLDRNGATIFDNTNSNNAWYIRNGGSNSATLQFGLGSPGQNIKHTFNGDGSVDFTGPLKTDMPNGKWRVNTYGAMYFRNSSNDTHESYIHSRSDGSLSIGRVAESAWTGTGTAAYAATTYDHVTFDTSSNATFSGDQVRVDTAAGGFYLRNASGGFRGAFHDNGTTTSIFADGNGSTPALSIESNDVTFAGSISATSGSFTEEVTIADVVDGPFTALRLMNQKTYGSGTGTNEKVRFAMGIAESGIAYSGREGFVIDVGIKNESDSSNAVINFQARDGGVIGTYQTVNGHDKSVEFIGTTTFKHGGTTNKTVFGSGNEINTFTAAGAAATMYLNWQSGKVNIGKSALVVENQGDSTFKGSIHPHADSTYNIGTDATRFAKIYADNFYGDGSNLTNVAAAAHNHDDRYYTETEIDANHYGKVATDAKFTSTDGSGDNYTFEIEDEGNFSGNKWYHVSTMDSGSGGLHIRGALLNHVENFASQKLDLAIQVREENDGGQLEIAGTVDVLHNDSATNGTDKCGIRVIKSADNGTYDQFKVYVRTTRYQQLTLRLTQQGSVTFNTDHSSPLTSEPAPVSGGHVEIDTSTLTEGHHTIIDSVAKLTVAKDAATFAGRVDSQVFSIDGASVASYQDFQSKPIDTDSGMFTVGGHGEQGGYSRAVSLWTSHDGSWNSWVGTNLRWDGTNFKRASDNGSMNWGNISGIRFLGNSSPTGSGMDFLIDPPTQTDAPNGEQTIGTSIPASMIALSLRNDLSADFKGDVKLSTGKSIYLSGTSGLRLTHDGSNAHVINGGTGDLNFKNDASDKDIFFTGTDGTTAVTALTLDMSEGGNATFAGKVILGKDSSNALEVFSSGDTEIGFSYATKGNIYAKIIGDVTDASPLGGELAFQTSTGGALAERMRISKSGVVTFSAGTYHKIQTYYSGDYTSGFKFSDYNGGIWYDAGADDLTLNSGHANSQILFNSGNALALTLDSSQNATFEGDVNIAGDLNITGDINSVSVTDLDVTDKTITIAKGAADSAAADGAGIVVDGAGASLLYDHTGTQWEVNKPFEVKVGTSAITMTEYSNSAYIWLDGSDGDFIGGDYYNIAAIGGGSGSKLSFGYAAAEKMYMDRAGNFLTTGVIDVKGTGLSTIDGALYIKGSGYNQIKIANNLTANTNKQSGIVTENYEGNNVSILQTFQQNNINSIYYGSADSAYAGVQNHYFFVNADSDTATSGHDKAFQIKSNKDATFYGNVSVSQGNSVGKFAVMSTGVHSSYDFYNNGTSYFNGAVTIDDNLTMPTNSHIEMGGNWTIQGTDGTYFQRIKTIDSSASSAVDTFSFDVKLGSSASWKSLLVLDQHDAARFSGSATFAGDVVAPLFETTGTGYLYLGGHVRLNNPGSGAFKLGQYNGSAWADTLNITNAGNATFLATATAIDFIATAALRVGGNERWKIRGNSNNQQLAFEYSTSGSLADSNIKLELNNDGDATLEGVAHIKKGLTTDGNAKFYNWRALQNTTTSSNLYYRIARITGDQSTRFIIELAGRSTSYGDEALPAYGKLVGQLNNDNNYDLFYYDHSNGSAQVVTEIGQSDVSATETDIYIKVGQFAEITAIGHISDGSITTYDSDSGATSAPTNYKDAKETEVWNSYNDGTGSGLDADKVDGIHASSFLRSDANDTASGSYTFTGSIGIALDSSWANSMVRFPETTNANPTMMFHRPTGSAQTTYPWRFQAGGGGSSTGFYIGTGSAANVGAESITNKFGLSNIGTLTVSGDVIAYGSPSDAKYKENVKPIENALDKVMDLEGVSFDWKEGDDILDIKEDIGFIAQDVQKVIPELVRENEDGNLSLRYQGIIPVLLEAMKEQQKQIDELKSQMAACNQRACDCKK